MMGRRRKWWLILLILGPLFGLVFWNILVGTSLQVPSDIHSLLTSSESAFVDNIISFTISSSADKDVAFEDVCTWPHCPNATCPLTCRIDIVVNRQRPWEVKTYDCQGQPKTQGGDEFYIAWEAGVKASQAVAWVNDLQNGTYRLDFQCTPAAASSPQSCSFSNRLGERGKLTVVTQYSCGIGALDPPQKKEWQTGGSLVYKHSTFISQSPMIQPFTPPIIHPNLWEFDKVIGVGDSVMQQFLDPLGIKIGNLGRPLNTTTLPYWKQHITEKYGVWLGFSPRKMALVIGSAVWDLLEDSAAGSIQDHQSAWFQLIQHLQMAYPNVTLFWKSPTALHVHVPMLQIQQHQTLELERRFSKQKFYERLKYMSSSRSYRLYQLQKTWCQDAGIGFLDVYPATYLQADETQIGDGRHYTTWLNTRIANWFVNESQVERLWRLHLNQNHVEMLPGRISRKGLRLLLPQRCETWMDLINAVLVAVVTNRKILWKPDVCSLQINPQNGRRIFVDDSIKAFNDSSLPQHDALQLPAMNDVFTSDKLQEQGYLFSGLSQQLAKEFFSEGTSFLYGMVLDKLLPSTADLFAGIYGHGDSIPTVHNDTVSIQFLRQCLSQVLGNPERSNPSPRCLVLGIEELPAKIGSLVKKSYNCTIVPIQTTTLFEIEIFAGILLLQKAQMSVRYVAEYLREVRARREGVLPIDELPYCLV